MAHIVWSLRIDLRKILNPETPSILRIRDLFRTRTSHISQNDSKHFGAESEVHWTGDFSIYLLANRKFVFESRKVIGKNMYFYLCKRDSCQNCNTKKYNCNRKSCRTFCESKEPYHTKIILIHFLRNLWTRYVRETIWRMEEEKRVTKDRMVRAFESKKRERKEMNEKKMWKQDKAAWYSGNFYWNPTATQRILW